jgi:hypothetical protein
MGKVAIACDTREKGGGMEKLGYVATFRAGSSWRKRDWRGLGGTVKCEDYKGLWNY